MTLRSWLFVPADSDRKLARAQSAGADALILDLEDSVAPPHKETARRMAREFLQQHPPGERRMPCWVRINALGSGEALPDLREVMGAAPDGIIMPKAEGVADVERLSHYLDAFEMQHDLANGSGKVLPIATETAGAVFRLGEYASSGLPRLQGLTWGAEDLAAAVGALGNRNPDGQWSCAYQTARALCLLAARAAGVQAVETVFVDFRDSEGLRATSRQARFEGFTGRLAIHPDQVAIINECFVPSKDEVERARRIVDAFARSPDSGTVSIDGAMYDIPHLRQAHQTLEQAGSSRPVA